MDDINKHKTLTALWESSQLAGANAPYVEALFEDYLSNPNSVSKEWQAFFNALPRMNGQQGDQPHQPIKEAFRNIQSAMGGGAPVSGRSGLESAKQSRVIQLINAYRFRGHLRASINPLLHKVSAFSPLPRKELTEADLDTTFSTGSLAGPSTATLRDILSFLEDTYCGPIGFEYMYLTNSIEKRWIQEQIEAVRGKKPCSKETKLQLLEKLTAAEGLEKHLHVKYVGQKRFSLEGAESVIPMLDEIIQHGGEKGVKEIVIGMAHRGRLNVLVNIMGKTPAKLFSEFEGTAKRSDGYSGDVKYHQGFSSNIDTAGGSVHVALSFNPSHLEIVGPVVEGAVRARQDRNDDQSGDQVVPVIIHGDAAFAGQGVVMETFNMSQSRGYSTKGTIHIVINNQVGFTTSNQRDARSTLYCTDVAKMVNAPIFHVNGDDPEAVLFVTQMALDYRMRFHKDVVIDMICYRRHGHNEADEPWVTQPIMYKAIRELPTTRALYAKQLEEEGTIKAGEADNIVKAYKDDMDAGVCVVKTISKGEISEHYSQAALWHPYLNKDLDQNCDTRLSAEQIKELGEEISTLPEDFKVHFAVKKILENRRKMANDEIPVDWGFAETMAYASLVKEGYEIRLSGQDCGRGTFFHRHATIHDQESDRVDIPLRRIKGAESRFLVINSLLSEEAVLGFEYGYSSTNPDTLTIWEAQFGDFANGAQVVIDQFISAGEQKWGRLSGLVMMLPHGYEGQGPEHSSARLERYLQLAAQNNMQICMPTSAAQIFHLLRRQMLMQCRKPLIIMTPKSLLRHKDAASPLWKLTDNQFLNIIPDTAELEPKKVTRMLVCSGKVYYDLYEKRKELERDDVVILRMEQLYPFPVQELRNEIERYPNLSEFVWCQEEPKNQGAWFTSQHHVRTAIGDRGYLTYAGRDFHASPACGYGALHKEQLENLLNDAFRELHDEERRRH
jgi:2-oxoglutarate dehydrogenase E1 component